MRITINIVRRDAAALTGVVRELNQVQASAKKAGGLLSNWGDKFNSVTKFGKNLQWTGRQLEYRFTLPLVLAGAAATKFALDNERALTSLRKVYGSVGDDQAKLDAEVKKLGEAFVLLSGIFGVHQDEVIGVAASWAAAGASGAALAKRTRSTLEAMILGDLEAADATEALITVSQAYKLSADDLTKALATLNIVENETAVTMADLIKGTQVVGGAAREAGVDIRHLAAYMAALVPAGGTASEAANSLKTTIASIMAPTGVAADAIAALGVNLESTAWASSNFDQRINILADSYANLTQNQKLQWARNVVNIRQISRLAILLNDIADAQGRYNKALEVSGDDAKNAAQYQRELGIVLSSQPRAFQAMIVQIQNSLAQIILPMLPVILSVLNEFRKLIKAFTELSPRTQKIVLSLLAMLAVLGPVLAYTGSFAILIGELGKAVFILGKALVFVVTNPVALFVVALVAAGIAAYVFRDQIGDVVKSVGRSFWGLVQTVGNALVAVWKVVFMLGKKIYEALSYLNPFARHSPSLVDNVRAGVATILDEYGKLSGIGRMLRDTQDDVQAFARATDNIAISGSSAARAKDREDLAGLGASPEALAIFDRMTQRMAELKAMLPTIQAEIDAQAIVVARWADELKRADLALVAAQDGLEALREEASKARDELDAAKGVLDDLFSYNITGEQAASDALFENEMAVKALRLELLKLEESGQSVEEVTDQLGKLSGEIEKMQALEKSLRLAGAGSEVTGPIRAQIAALDAQRRALSAGGGGSKANDIKKQIDLLERQGEILELERSIKFDPLRRQLDLLKNGFKEMDFDSLVTAIKAQQEQVAILTTRYEDATKAVDDQEKVVKDLTAARDEISRTYDRENDKLDALKDAYDAVTQAINEMDDAVAQLKADSGGGADAGLGVPGDFAVPGGSALDNTDQQSIDDLIAKWTEEMQGQFDKFDLLAGLRAKFEEFRVWLQTWKEKLTSFWAELSTTTQPWVDGITGAFATVTGAIGTAWDWVVEKTTAFWESFNKSIQPLKNELAKWGELWDPFVEACGNLWTIIEPFIKALGWFLRQNFEGIWIMIQEVWDIIASITGIAWNLLVGLVTGFLQQLRGVFNIALGLLTGDWGRVWEGIKGIFQGFMTGLDAIWEATKGIFTKVIPDVLDALKKVFTDVFNDIKDIVGGVWDGMASGAATGVNKVIDVVNGLIHGINWVIEKLHIGVAIPDIGHVSWGGGNREWNQDPEKLARGGITNGPMAIVGEGRRAYPEFVIPSDPRYRGNAHALLAQAMGIMGVPKMALGGLIGNPIDGIGDAVSGIGDAVEDGLKAIRKAAVMVGFAPFLKTFDLAMNALPNGGLMDVLKGSANWMKNEVYNWAKGAAYGGIVPASPGGTLLRLGEKGYAEKIIPLDAARRGGGGATIIINGNLEFPNVHGAGDADGFVRNLKVLAS